MSPKIVWMDDAQTQRLVMAIDATTGKRSYSLEKIDPKPDAMGVIHWGPMDLNYDIFALICDKIFAG